MCHIIFTYTNICSRVFYKVVVLVGGGSVIKRATLSIFFKAFLLCEGKKKWSDGHKGLNLSKGWVSTGESVTTKATSLNLFVSTVYTRTCIFLKCILYNNTFKPSNKQNPFYVEVGFNIYSSIYMNCLINQNRN